MDKKKTFISALLNLSLIALLTGCIPEEIAGIDSDGDTITDTVDNCPLTPNTDQADEGTIGEADNGIGDACDSNYATEYIGGQIWDQFRTEILCEAGIQSGRGECVLPSAFHDDVITCPNGGTLIHRNGSEEYSNCGIDLTSGESLLVNGLFALEYVGFFTPNKSIGSMTMQVNEHSYEVFESIKVGSSSPYPVELGPETYIEVSCAFEGCAMETIRFLADNVSENDFTNASRPVYSRFGVIAALDSDKDSILDTEDNCPDIFNPEQEDTANNGAVEDNGIGDACEIIL